MLSDEQLPKWSILLATIVKTRSKPIIRFQQSNLHMAKINAGKASDMPPNSITKLENADVSVANVNGEFYAITDTCTHAGASMANGKIDGENIICGWHSMSPYSRLILPMQHLLNVKVENLQSFQQK